MTDAGFAILPTATFADLPAADILCVPGGMGVNAAIADDATIDWVRRVGERAAWATSVCTGSLILGAAGLLRGYRAACHWAQLEQLYRSGSESRRLPDEEWRFLVRDITSIAEAGYAVNRESTETGVVAVGLNELRPCGSRSSRNATPRSDSPLAASGKTACGSLSSLPWTMPYVLSRYT